MQGRIAGLLPVVVVVTVRAGILPSKMLVTLAFLASGGSLLTLTASPVNIVLSHGAASAGGREFGYFEFALVGVPLVAMTILIVLFAGDRRLPTRKTDTLPMPDPASHARALRDDYSVDVQTRALFTAKEGVAGALILLRVVAIPAVYRAVPWSIVILVGGMIPLSTAFVDTGAAALVADSVLSLLGSASGHLSLFVFCVIAMVLGQFMSNLATMLVMMPVGIAISQSAGLSPQPFMMGLAVCGAAAFLTLVATAGNLMVMGARRLPVRRLLAAPTAAHDRLPAARGLLRAAHLAVLSGAVRSIPM